MSGQRTFVIVGAGEAGGFAVLTLRAEGFDGSIVALHYGRVDRLV